MKGPVQGVLGALAGGIVGAAVWAAISYFTNFEIGWIAWLVGIAVGMGMAWGAGEHRSVATGVIAAVIALASIGAGKYLTVHLMLSQSPVFSGPISDADAQMYLAGEILQEQEAAGTPLTWPAGQDADGAEKVEDYPKPVADETKARWNAMPQPERDAYKQMILAQIQSAVGGNQGALTWNVFKATLGPFDALWAFLALSSAFKIGGASSAKPTSREPSDSDA